ncbi:MAG: hypothetical protein A2Y91_01410 [Chloroflexi bacterium RBG_13_54_8]|nr:MAG: hypothetical protein A2Y91_01410 [Chloroflexi bacterium RBG_13_54_8]
MAACISPDGKPTQSGIKLLQALKSGAKSPDEVAQDSGLPLFRVRSGLRELAQAGFVNPKADGYELLPAGRELISSLP